VSFPKTNYPASSTQKYNINLEARGKSLDAANAVFSQVQFLLRPTLPLEVDLNKHYYIKSYNQNLYACVTGGSLDDYANIMAWNNYNKPQLPTDQKNCMWQVIKNAEGVYNLVARHSGKLMDVHSASKDDGVPVIQYRSGTGTLPTVQENQSWQIFYKDGKVKLQSKNSGKCLQRTGVNSNIQQYTCANVDSQLWELVEVEKSVPATFAKTNVRIQNVYSGLMADVANGAYGSGTDIWQHPANNGGDQDFNIRYAGLKNGTPIFRIEPSRSPDLTWDNQGYGNYIKLQNASTSSAHALGAHGWEIYDNGDGTYSFINAADKGKFLDLANCSKNASVALKLQGTGFNCDNGNSSKWRIVEAQAPKIVSVTPSNFSYVHTPEQINVEFSQPLDRNTVNPNSFYLTDSSGSKVNGTIAFLTDKQIAFKPSLVLVKGRDYTINLDANLVGNSAGAVSNFSGIWTSKFAVLNLLGSSSWPHTYVTQLRNQYSQKWANVRNGDYNVGTPLIQYQREFGSTSASGFRIQYAGTFDQYGAMFDISSVHANTLQIGNAGFARLTRDRGQWYIHYNKDDLSYTFISTLEAFSRGTPPRLNLNDPNYSDHTLLAATKDTYVDSSGKRSDRWIVGPRYDAPHVSFQITNPNNGCSWDVWDDKYVGGSNPQRQIVAGKPNFGRGQSWQMWLQINDGYHINSPYYPDLRVALMTDPGGGISNQAPTNENDARSTFDVVFPPDLDGTMIINRSVNKCLKNHRDQGRICWYGVQAVSCNASDREQIWHLNRL
jgi:hypothetical protein